MNLLELDLRKYARESIKIKKINKTVYVYGSELATLRILRIYRYHENARHGYSKKINSFYFALVVDK